MQSGGKAQTILVVDDESIVLNLCSKILAQAGYRVLTAINAGDALDIARACKHSIEVALIDVMMPGVNGLVLADRLVKLHPEASLVFMSGYQDYQIAKFRPFEFKWFLRKPFKPADLIRIIQQPLEEARKRGPHQQGNITYIRKDGGE
jgi:two-component system cell cycle sensor histidine kinase/response regulator CckA